MGVQAALECQREGRPWSELSEHTIAVIEAGGLTPIVELFATALAQFHDSDFFGCIANLDSLPYSLGRRLAAEADYSRATCLVDTRSTVDREAAVDLLERWVGYEDEEAELGSRLMHIRLFALSLRLDKEPGRILEARIRQGLMRRGDFDLAAHDAMYSLDRCAASLYEPDLALIRTREAAKHFGPSGDQTVLRRPGEYFRSLVNLGAELLINAHYEEALAIHAELEDLVSEYAPGAFPRLDWSRSNGILAEFRAGAIDLTEAIRKQRETVAHHRVPADPFYVENALAVYLALAGSDADAIEIFDRLHEQLEGMDRPEASTMYLISANRCTSRYVSGAQDAAYSEWLDLADLVVQIPYATRRYHIARHELLGEVMRRGVATSPAEFDVCLLGLPRFGRLWDQVGRGFRLPEVEWWH